MSRVFKDLTDPTDATLNAFGFELQALIQRMLNAGYVGTVEVLPKEPLAMGNYSLGVSVRKARDAS